MLLLQGARRLSKRDFAKMPDYPAAYVQALRAAGLTTRSTREDIALLDEESLKDLLVSLLQVLNALEAAGTSTHMIQGFLRPILPHQQVSKSLRA